MFIASVALFLAVILLSVGFASSLSATAQQTTTTPLLPPPPSSSSSGTKTGQSTSPSLTSPSPSSPLSTSPPLTSSPTLTPQEQEQLTRLQNVIAATNQNLDETEKQIGGIVYTPRWSDPVWVEPDSAAVLVAYCLPGEFAESGQEILGGGGGFELEVLESYEVALPQNFTAWMMVIGNEDRQNRYPAAVGVICASDANNAETRVLSTEEQQQINNAVQQFSTTTSIDQVINVINRNNATTPLPPQNGNTTTPTTPPGGTSSSGVGGITISASDIKFLPSDATGVDVRAETRANTYDGPCPVDASFSGTITDYVGNRDVTYRFIYGEQSIDLSTGATTPQQTIHFDQPGSQTVTYTTSGLTPPSLNGWFAIEILEPIQLQSNEARMAFRITCSSGDGISVRATSITPPLYEGPCPPPPFTFSGQINDSIGGRDITYRWRGTDGYTGPATIHFDNPGTQQVPLEWETLQRSNTTIVFWLEIMSPIQLESNILTWEQKCTTTPSTGGAAQAPQTLQAENDTTTAATDDDEDDTTPPAGTTDGAGGAGLPGGEGGGGGTTEGGGGTTEGGGGTTEGGGGDASDTDNGDQSSPPAGTTTTDGAGGGGGGTDGSTDDDDAEPQ